MAVTAEAQRASNRQQAAQRGGEYRSTALMSGLRMSGKLLGLVKTLVIAATFGATAALDAFWIAYAMPMILPGMIRGVVATAFIPGFMRSSRGGETDIDWRGLNTLFTAVVITIVVLCVLVVVFRHPIVAFMAPGLDASTHDLAAELTALMSLAVFFFGLNAIFCAILQALHRFVVMSLESVVTNVVIIAGCVTIAQTHGVQGLAVSVIAGFAVHAMMLAWANRDLLRDRIRPAFSWQHEDFRGPANHMFPLLIGYVGSIAMAFIDRMFVSTLEAGMISVLAYASMIALLPMEVFGQAVMTAFYPTLSRDHADGNARRMRETHLRGLRLLLFVLVPVLAALVFLAQPVVSLLLERGQFSADDAAITGMTLAALALGLVGRAVNYFNFRVFHARQEPWAAVFIGLFGVLLNAALDWVLIREFGILGIAFATSIALTTCALVSSFMLQRRLGTPVLVSLAGPLAKLVVMSAGMIAVAMGVVEAVDVLPIVLTPWQENLVAVLAMLPGGLVFLLLGFLLRLHETRVLIDFLRHGKRALRGEGA